MGTYEYLLEWGGIKNQPWSESGVGTEIGNPPYTVAIPSLKQGGGIVLSHIRHTQLGDSILKEESPLS